MDDQPTFEGVFYGGNGGRPSPVVRTLPMVLDERHRWVVPDTIETQAWQPEGSYFTGQYVRIHLPHRVRPVYIWDPITP